jgi:hypothetical protein
MVETNTQRVQILRQFVDHRGNVYSPGVYAPGTLLMLSLKRADYITLEDDQAPTVVEEDRITVDNQSIVMRRNDPVQTKVAVKNEEPATDNKLTNRKNTVSRRKASVLKSTGT